MGVRRKEERDGEGGRVRNPKLEGPSLSGFRGRKTQSGLPLVDGVVTSERGRNLEREKFAQEIGFTRDIVEIHGARLPFGDFMHSVELCPKTRVLINIMQIGSIRVAGPRSKPT